MQWRAQGGGSWRKTHPPPWILTSGGRVFFMNKNFIKSFLKSNFNVCSTILYFFFKLSQKTHKNVQNFYQQRRFFFSKNFLNFICSLDFTTLSTLFISMYLYIILFILFTQQSFALFLDQIGKFDW